MEDTDAIHFLNRYTRSLETEEIYGEGYLRWIYDSPLGKLALHALAKRALFSKWYGWRMDRRSSREKVQAFIRQYEVDTSEFLDPVDSYATFNEFFYRKLKQEARPVCADPRALVFPADGRHLTVERWEDQRRFYAKGQRFDLLEFLGDAELAERYETGSGLISRLCPTDYHRFHSPVAGRIVDYQKINGYLFSVSPVALRRNLGYLWENKREVLLIESDQAGLVAYAAIGATCVGGIAFTKTVGERVEKGEELGYFAFGGSCVATFYEADKVIFDGDLLEAKTKGLELYGKVGDRFGELEVGL